MSIPHSITILNKAPSNMIMHFLEIYKYLMFCCTVHLFLLVPAECKVHYLQIIYYVEMQTDYL
jgi:hypothetical protein